VKRAAQRTFVVPRAGTGAACATAFGCRGAILYHADRDAAEVTVGSVRAAGGTALAAQAQVDDEGSVEAA